MSTDYFLLFDLSLTFVTQSLKIPLVRKVYTSVEISADAVLKRLS